MIRPEREPGGILDRILQRRREDVREKESRVGVEELRRIAAVQAPTRGLRERLLAGPWGGVIAEVKRASPSAGALRADLDPAVLAAAYAEAGAVAISVLTEPEFFGGAPEDLVEVRARVDLPLLRKDFLVGEYQVIESRALGADCVLLIASALARKEMELLLRAVRAEGMEALVEVHDEDELAAALDAGADLIGVNNRDLRDFRVDLGVCLRLAPRIPPGVARVAESGIRGRRDLEAMRAAGYHAVLVGEALLRAPDPGAALRELVR